MDCPFCKIPMRQGYFQCGMALWSEKKHALTLNPGPEEAYALSLGKTMFPPPSAGKLVLPPLPEDPAGCLRVCIQYPAGMTPAALP